MTDTKETQALDTIADAINNDYDDFYSPQVEIVRQALQSQTEKDRVLELMADAVRDAEERNTYKEDLTIYQYALAEHAKIVEKS